jgi:hypothetical protein
MANSKGSQAKLFTIALVQVFSTAIDIKVHFKD